MPDPSFDPLLTSVQEAVVQAYYPDRVRAATGARTRAQAAQSVVTVFAGGLVATFTLTSLSSTAVVTRIGGCLAVALWLLAAVLYVRAISTAVPLGLAAASVARDGRSLIEEVLKRGDDEAKRVDQRQVVANRSSVVALGVTVLTLALALFVDHPDKSRLGWLVLGPEGQAVVAALCGNRTERVEGEIDLTTLTGQFISITVDRCGSQRQVTLRLPKNAVTAVLTKEG
ncbi:hypothetical protein [Micromonospora humidisoli]|uniref:Uncharacterized protein n=1 Tax=Micromonospora humidisoli TaxID=2807622 RepID=A0ABS2JJ45_9ACTN|nr:hypothetical protein [Micromonospora humidisoli]MBM7086246.1 hypothetical protein [Micromonospora humidisoli]